MKYPGLAGLLPAFVRNVVQMQGAEGRLPEICMKRRTNTGD